MKLETAILGEIEYSEDEIITAQEGLYGFGDKTKFILINIADENLPFQWLQSVDDGDLSFIITNPFLFHDAYDFELQSTVTEALKIESLDDVSVFSLVVLKDELKDATINLKAPLVLNTKNKQLKQVILIEDYPYKHQIFSV